MSSGGSVYEARFSSSHTNRETTVLPAHAQQINHSGRRVGSKQSIIVVELTSILTSLPLFGNAHVQYAHGKSEACR